MQYTDFFNQIRKKELSGAYLLYGPEQYIQQSAVEQAARLIGAEDGELNVQKLTRPAVHQIIDACETLPFFCEQRLVVCRGLGDGEPAELARYLPQMPPSAVLLLCMGEKPDARTSLWKTLSAMDRTVACGPLSDGERVRWVMQHAHSAGVEIRQHTADELVHMAGATLLEISNELQKAVDYVGQGGEITPEVLHSCVTSNPEYQMFDMLEHFLAGRKDKGLAAMHGLLRSRSAVPLEIASFFSGRLKLMLTGKLLLQSGCTRQEAVRRMGGNPYAAEKALQAAKRFSVHQLRQAAAAFSDVDYLQKSGQGKDVFALEQAVLLHF